MATEFSTEFDLSTFDGTKIDGDAANLDTENPGGAVSPTVPGFINRTGANGWAYDTAVVASGDASILCTNDAGLTSVWTYSHGLDRTLAFYEQCYYVTSLPTAEVIIGQIRSTGTNRAQITLQPTGAVRIKEGTTARDSTVSGYAVAGQWLRWQWGIGQSPGTAQNMELRLWTDATPANLFVGSPSATLQGTYAQGTWNQYRLGMMSGEAITVGMDRFIVDTDSWPSGGGSGNQLPVANAGPDQDTLIAGDLVTLDGTGSSDPDGTIASYLWTQTVGNPTTVTLSNNAVAQPTFTCPSGSGFARFSLVVTDNDGGVSPADTVDITWSAASVGNPTSDFYELFEGGADNNTVTNLNTSFDTVDSGFTFTSEDPIGGGALGVEVTGSGATHLLTHVLPGGLTSNAMYVDCVFQIDNLAGGPYYLYRVADSGTLRASVRVNTNGTVEQRDNLTAGGTPAGTIQSGVPFRLAWHPNNGGTMEARLFTGANVFSDTGYTATTRTMSAGTFDRISIGIAAPAAASGRVVVDSVQVDYTTWPTVYTGSVPDTYSELYEIDANGDFLPTTMELL